MSLDQLVFFLGGNDLEMLTIRSLLERHVPSESVYDRHLSWGAPAESYREELQSTLDHGRTPVLIELSGGEEWSRSHAGRGIIVDHHDGRAGSDRPSSLRQVFDLLGRPATEWSRWFALVDANDKGHIRAMQAVGATLDELREVRARDRAAQGVTIQQEEEARCAAEHARVLYDGQLTIAELPHDRTSPVADALESALGGPGFQNLLIIAAKGRHFFGDGGAVLKLREQFGGWSGGMLPERGFWGTDEPISAQVLLSVLAKTMARQG